MGEFYKNNFHMGWEFKKNKPYYINTDTFVHMVCLGKTKSGKTITLKALVEEAIIRKIACIVLDPAGDIVRIAEVGQYDRKNNKGDFVKTNFINAEKRIFTPMDDSGIPISINPFKNPDQVSAMSDIEYKKYIGIISNILTNITDASHNEFSQISGEIYDYLEDNREVYSMKKLMGLLGKRSKSFKKLSEIYTGSNKMLFDVGIPLDIDLLMNPIIKNKTPLNLIYLPSITDKENKQLFVGVFLRAIYHYLLKNPKPNTQLLLIIDEAQYYIPNRKVTQSSEIIETLIKEGRKFGLCMALASHNISNINYETLSQANYFVLGNITQPQDLGKVKTFIKNIMKDTGGNYDIDKHIADLTTMRPGCLKYLVPELKNPIKNVKARWLHTKHGEPINPKNIHKLNKEYILDYFLHGIEPNTKKVFDEDKKALEIFKSQLYGVQRRYRSSDPGTELMKLCNKCLSLVPNNDIMCDKCKNIFDI